MSLAQWKNLEKLIYFWLELKMKTQETVCIPPSSVVPTVISTDRHVLRVPNHMKDDLFWGAWYFACRPEKQEKALKPLSVLNVDT